MDPCICIGAQVMVTGREQIKGGTVQLSELPPGVHVRYKVGNEWREVDIGPEGVVREGVVPEGVVL